MYINQNQAQLYRSLDELETHLHQEIYPQICHAEFTPKSLMSKKSIAQLPHDAKLLAEKLDEMIGARFKALGLNESINALIPSKKSLLLKKTTATIIDASKTLKNACPEAWKITFERREMDTDVRDFVDKFNGQYYSVDKHRKKALDLIQAIKRDAWVFEGDIPKVPKADCIPAARLGLYQLFRCNDPRVKEEAIVALTELMEWDPLHMESAYYLVELQNGLLEEVRAAKAQNLNTTLQRKLIKAYAISIECFLLHAGAGHLNAMADETKQENWTGAEEMEGLNISHDPEIKFWAKYAIQGIQYIKSDKSTLKSIIDRVGKIAHAGILIGVAVANPGNAAELVTSIFEDLIGSIHHIQWRKEWFNQLLVLKKLCRFTILEPTQFRQISNEFRNKKNLQTTKALLYGTVTVIENVLMNTPSREIREEGLKLLLDYFTIEHVPTRRRVIAAFNNLLLSEDLVLNHTSFGILKILSAAGKLPEGNPLPDMKIDPSKIYENVWKFLLLRLAEIKGGIDVSGHSLVTLLCKSEEEKVVAPLFKCLVELCPDFQGPDPSGNTGFHVMIRQGFISTLKFIPPGMRAYVNVQENEQHYTALHDAVLIESVEAVRFLIELNANINLQDRQGNTPLHYAAQLNNVPLAELLLSHKAEPNTMNNDGKTALNIALESECTDIIFLLLNYDATIAEETQEITPIMLMAKAKNIELLEALIEYDTGNISEAEALEIARFKSCRPDLNWKFHRQLRRTNSAYNIAFSFIGKQSHEEYHPQETALMSAIRAKESNDSLERAIQTGDHPNEANESGERALHLAVLTGSRNAIRTLIQHDADVNAPNIEGNTPLHYAAFKRDAKTVELLLKNGANPSKKNIYGDTPYLLACGGNLSKILSIPDESDIRSGQEVETLNHLIQYGAVVTDQDALGNNPLIRATMSGAADVVQFHLKHYPDMLWERNRLGNIAAETALFFYPDLESGQIIEFHNRLLKATENRLPLGNLLVSAHRPQLFRKLIEHDPDLALLQDGTQMKYSPLHLAAIQGNCAILQIYIEKKIQLEQTDATGNTAAHLAAFYNHDAFLKLLREAGCDFLSKNKDERTPLHLAAKGKMVDVINAVKNEKNLLEVDTRGDTALHIASRSGNDKILAAFFPTPNMVNDDGNTPLHISCMFGNEQGVKFFIQKEGNIEIKNAFGQTPILLAAQEGHSSIVSFLMTIGTNIWSQDEEGETLLHKAVFNHHYEVVHEVLEKEKLLIPPVAGGLTNAEDRLGETPLHELPKKNPGTGENKHLQILKALIEAGADPETQNQQGETFLHVVSYYGRHDLLKMLLKMKRRMPLIPRDVHGNTPLHKAVEGRHPDVVKELCSHQRKSGIKKKNDQGLTPLLLAVKIGFWEGARILIAHHASTKTTSNEGQTLFHHLLAHSTIDSIANEFLFEATNSYPKLLLETDDRGRTPLHMIAEQNHSSLLYILRFIPGKQKKMEKFIRAKSIEDMTAFDIADNKKHKKMAKKIRNFPRESLGIDYKSRKKTLKGRSFKHKKQVSYNASSLKNINH